MAETDPAAPRDLAPVAWAPVLGIAAATAAVLAALGTRYGYHRDELYYLAGGRHLDWGYVDHPPAVPALARLIDDVAGGSLFWLRAVGAVLMASLVVIGALLARELGGDRRAQTLTAAVVVAIPAFRATQLLLGTTGLDQLVWAVVLLLATRLLRTGDVRLWLPIGLVVGLGLEVKWLVLVLIIGLVVGLAVAGRRDLLRSGWLLVGGATAVVLWLPNLVWNASHDWATIEFQAGIGGDDPVGARLEFLLGQLLLTGLVGIVVWWPGWRWLVRRHGEGGEPAPFRALGLAVAIIFGALLVAGAKLYYPVPLYLPLLAAGVLALEHRSHGRRRTLVVASVAFVLGLPLSLPLLPPTSLDAIGDLNGELGEMVGWPELADQVEAAWTALPDDERATAVVLTANYGEAGAVERFAPEVPVYSGHNSYWWWDRPPEGTTTLVLVGYRPETAARLCTDPVEVTTITNDAGIHNDEAGAAILRCTLDQPVASWWPTVRHYD